MQAGPRDAILVPAKALELAKSRLGLWLDPSERRELALAMLADVLTATTPWRDRFVVTADPLLAEAAAAHGCLPVADPGGGLNPALRAGTARAVEAGAQRLLVLPSDVPLVSRDDLAALFSMDTAVVVACSGDGGTTGLLRTPPAVIDPAFGPGSARRHARAARRMGLTVRVVEPWALSLDVDGLREVERLARTALVRESVAVARRLLGGVPSGGAAQGLGQRHQPNRPRPRAPRTGAGRPPG